MEKSPSVEWLIDTLFAQLHRCSKEIGELTYRIAELEKEQSFVKNCDKIEDDWENNADFEKWENWDKLKEKWDKNEDSAQKTESKRRPIQFYKTKDGKLLSVEAHPDISSDMFFDFEGKVIKKL